MSRSLQPGEREEFRVGYGVVAPPLAREPCETRQWARQVMADAWRHLRPNCIIRVIWKAPPAKPKRDLWVRRSALSDCYDIYDGSVFAEGGFEFRSTAEDRVAELRE